MLLGSSDFSLRVGFPAVRVSQRSQPLRAGAQAIVVQPRKRMEGTLAAQRARAHDTPECAWKSCVVGDEGFKSPGPEGAWLVGFAGGQCLQWLLRGCLG